MMWLPELLSNIFSQSFGEVYRETQRPQALDQVTKIVLPGSDQDGIKGRTPDTKFSIQCPRPHCLSRGKPEVKGTDYKTAVTTARGPRRTLFW